MPVPVIPDIPGFSQSDPSTPSQKENIKASNTPPTLTDDASVVALSPNNTGLPVNVPTVVQKAVAASTGSVASLAKAFTSNNVAGNSIIVVCGIGNGTDPTIADTLGNTYTKANTAANSTTFEASIWYAVGILAGANTVTVTNAGTAASMAVEIYEVSGLLAQVTAQPEQSATNTGTGTTASTANVTPVIPNELFFAGVAVGTATQTITAGTGWNNDSGQQNPTTPAGLYSFASLSQYRGGIGTISPSATLAGSEPWAMAVASFRMVALGIEGKVNLSSPYPFGAIPITADSGNVAAATATATLAAVAGKTTYITGYQITSAGSTGAGVVTGTITGVVTGTLHFTYASVAGATLMNQPLIVPLPYAIPASAANTAIAVVLPSLGSGNTNATVSAYGFQL